MRDKNVPKMTFKTIIILLIIFINDYQAQGVEADNPETKKCFQGSKYPMKKGATKTPYYFVQNLNDSAIDDPDIGFYWHVSRHGTRYPSLPGLKLIKYRLPEISKFVGENPNELCPEDVLALQNWKPDLEEEDAKKLHPEGEMELINLAERIQKRFPKILDRKYDPYEFKFRATDT